MPTAAKDRSACSVSAGIDVFLHWSWFLVAAYEIQTRKGSYSSVTWNVLEYLALFLIVMIHEFGHALACRQVGGKADRIVLWPLGGVAYVDPPPRPGATLWSIAAGPLVNVALLPIFFVAATVWWPVSGWAEACTRCSTSCCLPSWSINMWLLVFNILPIYPLDGGQILRSLLWFVLGRARSLMVATILGLIGVAGFIGLALWQQDVWFGAIAVFMLMNCWGGLNMREPFCASPSCPAGTALPARRARQRRRWESIGQCGKCGQPFDTFQNHAICPHCSHPVPSDQVPGLRSPQSHERLDARLPRPFEILSCQAFVKLRVLRRQVVCFPS